MPPVPSQLPQYSIADFIRRIAAAFPAGWTSVEAKEPGGVFYAMAAALAGSIEGTLALPQLQVLTVGGTITAGDTITLAFSNPNLATPERLSYRVLAGDTAASIALSLAGLISADPKLAALGIRADAALAPQLTVIYPVWPPQAVWTTASPPANTTTIAASATGGETVTIQATPYGGPGSLQYAAEATRIQTAIGEALDLASADFLIDQPRLSGELDGAFRTRILANLLPTGATRAAVSAAVQRVTGQVPRIVEPWNPADTGVTGGIWITQDEWDMIGFAWDMPGLNWDQGIINIGAIYSDVDTAATPGRSTTPLPDAMRTGQNVGYQGFIDTALPTVPLLGGNPVPCADDGLYSGIAGCSTFNLSSIITGKQVVYNAINATKCEGTVAWVRFDEA